MNPESLTPGAVLWMMHNNKATQVRLLKVDTSYSTEIHIQFL